MRKIFILPWFTLLLTPANSYRSVRTQHEILLFFNCLARFLFTLETTSGQRSHQYLTNFIKFCLISVRFFSLHPCQKRTKSKNPKYTKIQNPTSQYVMVLSSSPDFLFSYSSKSFYQFCPFPLN